MSYEKESDRGSTEYKFQLLDLTAERVISLRSQIKFRLQEGGGECLYVIGVTDDGNPTGLDKNDYDESIKALREIVESLKLEMATVAEKENEGKYIGEYIIREAGELNYVDLKIAVAGSVDAGKSSTIGVLTRGTMDNGRGLARSSVFNFKHEIDSGRTSSIAHHIMGIKSNGDIVEPDGRLKSLTWPEIIERSSKVITFFDLCGHEHYLPTTMHGLNSTYPDYVMIMIGANMGVTELTKEHIRLCLMLGIPFYIVLTKLDICPKNKLDETMGQVKKIARSPGIRKITYRISTMEDVITASKRFSEGSIIPIFSISNVNGTGLGNLKTFLNLIPRRKGKNTNENLEMQIREIFRVDGWGTIVFGPLISGKIKVGDEVWLGPDYKGEYTKTSVKSIKCKNVMISEATSGHEITVCIRKITRDMVKKGMVLLSTEADRIAIREFIAKVHISKGQSTSLTIKPGYQAYSYIGTVRQTVEVVEIFDGKEAITIGDMAVIKFRFMIKPEYIKVGMRITFREGRTRGYGIIEKA